MDAVLSWTKAIIVYMIFVSALTHLLPSDSYKKYLRFISGLILVVVVMRPAVSLFAGGDILDELYERASVWQSKAERENILSSVEEAQEESVIRAYELEIMEQIKQSLQEKGYTVQSVTVHMNREEIVDIGLVLCLGKLQQGERDYTAEEDAVREYVATLYQVETSVIDVRIQDV